MKKIILRTLVGILCALGIGAAVVGVKYFQYKLSFSRIQPSQLDFKNVRLQRHTNISDVYVMSGRILNNSSTYTLKKVTSVVTIRDCVGDRNDLSYGTEDWEEQYERLVVNGIRTGDSSLDGMKTDCITIGEINESIYIDVPPGQARDFSVWVRFGFVKPEGRLVWDYKVSQTRAE